MLPKTLISLVLASFCWLDTSAAQAARPTATVASGQVVGNALSFPSPSATVNQFLGIPYASSPPLRFAPPSPAQPWTTPLDASSFGDTCVQQFSFPEASRNFTLNLFNNPGGTPPVESEDCLYINVFAPASPAPAGGRAVMFWVYGGALQFGSSTIAEYNGSYIAANQDVVLVTFNYRTNAFGFSNSPEIPAGQQNSGFLDQRFALQWVQSNIAAFGGDPTKVLIFGQSAGGYSVKQLLAVPPSPLPYRAAILESEATLSGNGLQSWEILIAQLNCSSATSQLACARAAPATTIKSIIEQNVLTFAPAFDNVTAVNNSAPSFSSGTAAKVPFMIGTTYQEGRPFAYEYLLDLPSLTLEEFVNAEIPNQPVLDQAIEAAYQRPLYDNSSYFEISAFFTDLSFLCPAAALSNIASSKYDVWRYFYNASFPNLQVFPDAGVYHASEIPLIFGTYPFFNTIPQEITLSQYMQKTWANFAKNPSAGPGWPKLGSNRGTELADIGAFNISGQMTISLNLTDGICQLYAPVLATTGL